MPVIRVIQGANKGRVYQLGDERVTIGRDSSETIQILDQAASREHAEVYRIGEMYFIRDLGSRNGTYMNEELKSQELLREGDRIRIGNTIMVFEDRKIMKEGEPFEFTEEDMGTTMEFNLASARTQRREKDDRDHSGDLSLLFEMAKTISSERQAKPLMEKIIEMLMRMTVADAAYVFVREEGTGRFVPMAFRQKTKTPGKAPKVSRTIIRRVLQDHRAIMTSNAAEDARFKGQDSILLNQIQSVVCAPLVARDNIKGVVYLTTEEVTKQFSSEDLEFITIAAMQTGIAFENIRAQERQRQIFLNTVQVLVDAAEAKDKFKKGRSQRVAGYVAGICEKLGAGEEEANNTKLAALLHDIGTLVEDEVIDLENLSEQEKEDLRLKQLQKMETLLRGLGISDEVLVGIISRFEKYDGSGFPKGLKKEDIPQISRVLSVAIKFDELLSLADAGIEDISSKEAVDSISTEAGASFDPVIAEALEIAHRDGSLYSQDKLFDSKLEI